MSRHPLRHRLDRIEQSASARLNASHPWNSRGFVLRVFLDDGQPTPHTPRHPDGRPVTLDDLRARIGGRDDLVPFARNLLADIPLDEVTP